MLGRFKKSFSLLSTHLVLSIRKKKVVDIKILGTEDLQEYEAAVQLKEFLAPGIPETVQGEILILPSFKCFGQETRDIDLIVFGRFDSAFERKVKTKGKRREGKEEDLILRRVKIENFFCCIEVKDHPKVKFTSNSRVIVKYKGKESDVTDQSEKQKYSIKNYLQDTVKWSPYICNLIWLRNISKEILKDNYKENQFLHNCLPSVFGFDWFLHLICVQSIPYSHGGDIYHISCVIRESPHTASQKIQQAYEMFNLVRDDIGLLTRQKLERITKSNILKGQKYAQSIGQRLVVIRGRAGTGKTIKLLHIAHDLCVQGEKRCLILTYNKALVSDIRRTLALASITSDITAPTISVKTIHSFMYDLLIGFGVLTPSNKDGFLKNYEKHKMTLLEYLEQGLLTDLDVQKLMKSKHQEVAWDSVLIDESQDWPINEKEILFRIFKPETFIVADGVDQLIRGFERTDWTSGVNYHKPIIGEKRSLRQKSNLCRFCSTFATNVNLTWDVVPKGDLGGGRILILRGDYTYKLYSRLLKECFESGNKEYEMLFLVPPSLVEKEPDRKFKWYDEWQELGISLWDGTSVDIRSDFPKDPSQHRVLQYDSCRGLEGWIVTCLHIDSFFEHKVKLFKPELNDELALYSVDEMKEKFAYQWLMMPFTRAIDTLVISFRNPSSKIAKMLFEIGMDKKDFVEFVD